MTLYNIDRNIFMPTDIKTILDNDFIRTAFSQIICMPRLLLERFFLNVFVNIYLNVRDMALAPWVQIQI